MSAIAPPPGTPVVVSPLSTLLATAYTQQPRINISASVCLVTSAAGSSGRKPHSDRATVKSDGPQAPCCRQVGLASVRRVWCVVEAVMQAVPDDARSTP